MENNSPLVFVIFGATGDLMAKKLMPAIYTLYARGEISQNLFLVGVGRREITTDQFRELMARAVQESVPLMSSSRTRGSALKADPRVKPEDDKKASGDNNRESFDLSIWQKLVDGIHYQQGLFEDAGLYDKLVGTLSGFDDAMRACVPRYFYLATPPENYETILKHLASSTLSEGCGQGTNNFTRVLIEKPFGKDLATARNLDKLLASIFEEKQIYRIDHYLGKETVQNILSLRFANGIFEPTWNHNFIDHIQITLAEQENLKTRGNFYEGIGAIRDVVQNHMLQMIALIAMEQPKAFDPTSIRDARSHALQKVRWAGDVVRGQYEGYLQEKDVSPQSTTETFVAAKFALDTPRWNGVPFYVRTGKNLSKKITEISIHYKKPKVCTGPACLFNEPEVKRNILSIRIEPNEGLSLRLMVKNPKGGGMSVSPVLMDFSYAQAFPGLAQPHAYEKLLVDAIMGDATLFARTDGIEASWSVIMKIFDFWKKHKSPLVPYTPGSLGPKEADKLIEKDGRSWFLEEKTV